MKRMSKHKFTDQDELPAVEFDSLLALYPTESRFVSKAWYTTRMLTGDLCHFRYPFTSEDLDYVTATQIPLYLSQLAYILLGTAIQRRDFPQAVSDVLEAYFHQMQAGRLFFVELNQTMKRPMWKKEPLIATLRIDRTRRLGNTGIAMISFNFNEDACYGDLKTAMDFSE